MAALCRRVTFKLTRYRTVRPRATRPSNIPRDKPSAEEVQCEVLPRDALPGKNPMSAPPAAPAMCHDSPRQKHRQARQPPQTGSASGTWHLPLGRSQVLI